MSQFLLTYVLAMKLSDSAPVSNKHSFIIYVFSCIITLPVLCIGGIFLKLGIREFKICNVLKLWVLPGSHMCLGNSAATESPTPYKYCCPRLSPLEFESVEKLSGGIAKVTFPSLSLLEYVISLVCVLLIILTFPSSSAVMARRGVSLF